MCLKEGMLSGKAVYYPNDGIPYDIDTNAPEEEEGSQPPNEEEKNA